MALDLEKILASINSNSGNKLPPVHLWHPERVGEIDIHIDDNMRWQHEGTYFQREALVRLLASILKKEGDDYFLVTPEEKMKIRVDDVPFEIINMQQNDAESPQKILVTNTEDIIRLENSSQWQLRNYQGTPVPYVLVRDNLWARVNRTVFYQMIAEAEEKKSGNGTQLFLRSLDTSFLLGDY